MNIDLGESRKDMELNTPYGSMDEEGKSYPNVYLAGKDDALADLPDSGTITFRFVKKESTTEKRKGKETYRCRLALEAITGVKEGSKPDPAFEDRETALSRLKAEAEAEDDEED